MRINNTSIKVKLAKAMADPDICRIVSSTALEAKSAANLSVELGIPMRSIYRYIENLNKLGILTSEDSILMGKGGRYAQYRSMVKSIMIKYEDGISEVDLIPNESILEKFQRFWNYMGR